MPILDDFHSLVSQLAIEIHFPQKVAISIEIVEQILTFIINLYKIKNKHLRLCDFAVITCFLIEP